VWCNLATIFHLIKSDSRLTDAYAYWILDTYRLEFKAVIVLPTIAHNYGNYPYGNYVGNAPAGKVITLNT